MDIAPLRTFNQKMLKRFSSDERVKVLLWNVEENLQIKKKGGKSKRSYLPKN
jgi:hypothetical protein